MRISMKKLFVLLLVFVLLLGTMSVVATALSDEEIIEQAAEIEDLAAEEHAQDSKMYSTFWSLVPPIIAIVLALVTKEVYISLFIGILAGGLFHANFNIEHTITGIFEHGFIASLSDSWNVGILLFLVILGIIVVLINKAGGSAAYGEWAIKRIKTRKGAQLATLVLGILIFIDDYFNCLTVGNVMRPVTDKHNVSRAKLAYLVDSTAAPVCMIAPISSWAAAVAGVAGYAGITLFVKAIPYNFYSLLTLLTVFLIIVWKVDFGPMRKHEKNAEEKGDLFTTDDRPYADSSEEVVSTKGKVIDLVIPVVVLIIFCVVGMVYTGGFFSGASFIDSFSDSDASLGLTLGSFLSLVFTLIWMPARRVLSFKDCMAAIPDGFKAMVPAILILTFAWTLSGMTGILGGAEFVAGVIEGSAAGFMMFLPAIIFLVAVGLSFSTGTSWGTFGILIPIVVNVLDASDPMLIISVSACLAGAVCGDHCSPISDTTIMSSTGAQSNHINHVSTQLPYALVVAAVSFVTYIVAGATKSAWISLPVGIVLMAATLLVIKKISDGRDKGDSPVEVDETTVVK